MVVLSWRSLARWWNQKVDCSPYLSQRILAWRPANLAAEDHRLGSTRLGLPSGRPRRQHRSHLCSPTHMHPALGHSSAARRGSSCDTALHRHPAEAQSPHCQMVWLPALASGPQLCSHAIHSICWSPCSAIIMLRSCRVRHSFSGRSAQLSTPLWQPTGRLQPELQPCTRPGAPATETSPMVVSVWSTSGAS
jgi:hypothetical protein